MHVAGGSVRHDEAGLPGGGLYHDTHTDPVPDPVLGLLEHVLARAPGVPVLLERDGRYPPAHVLTAELTTLAATARPQEVSPASEHGESRVSPHRVPHLATAHPTPHPAVSPATEHAELAVSPRRVDDPDASTVTRAALAERQAALVAALVAGEPDPAGFDAVRLAAARRALLRKRAGEAAKAWPVLAASLGARWASTFAAHHAGRAPGGALRDGWDLARALRAELTTDAAAELAEREALLRYDGVEPPRPRPRGRVRLALRRFVR